MDHQFDPIPQTYEDLLHEVFDQSSQGFQVIDSGWRYLYINSEVARQGKSSPDKLIGHTMMEMYPGIEDTPLFVQLKRVMEQKISIRMENEFTYPDGKKSWFQLYIHPFPGGIYIFSMDITQRKKQENLILEKVNDINRTLRTPADRRLLHSFTAALSKLFHQQPAQV